MVFLTPDQLSAVMGKLHLPSDLESVVFEGVASGIRVTVWNTLGTHDTYIIDRLGGIRRG